MPTVHLTTGLPASGKTTRALQLLADSGGTVRRVNMDDIRAMLDGHGGGRGTWTHRHEKTAMAVQEAAILAAVGDGFDVVVDNTHLTASMAGRLRSVLAQAEDITFVVHDFTDVTVEECLARDAARANPVGEEVIRRLDMKHRSARRSGWRLTAEWMSQTLAVEPYRPVEGLPSAVMVDIDGTLALNVSRGPYDFTRCGEDALNVAVADAVRMYGEAGHRVVVLSGRSEEFRPQTEKWLAAHGVAWDELWMRPAGDTRRDDAVKLDLFDAHVRHRFAVRVSLDDRDRVVALWRRLGLPTFQVNYGDF
ncbi:AAA family ATPase [Kitasatospora sp. NBC_00315]|uniref:phosphatase domain-containing protein n=1 Tax=Kitasatospora sp. NBC_00315 TaxID=2975963 RepID=UPI00324B1EBA